jgi:diguanylate cyclase (GGDEF)-like protein
MGLILNICIYAEPNDPNTQWTRTLKNQIDQMATKGYSQDLEAWLLSQIQSDVSIQKQLYTKILDLHRFIYTFDEINTMKTISDLQLDPLLKSWPYAEMVVWEAYCNYNDALGISSVLLEGGYNLLTLANAQKDQDMKGKALLFIGKAYYYMISDDKAKEYLDQSVALSLETQDYLSVANYYYIFADTYFSYGDFQTALEYYQASQPYLEKEPRKALLETVKFDLDLLYARSKYKLGFKDLSYTTMAELEKKTNPKNTRVAMSLYWQRAKQYYLDELYDASLSDIKKAVELSSQLGEDQRLNSNHNAMLITLASALYRTGDSLSAAEIFVTMQDADQDESYIVYANESASIVSNVESNIVKEQINLISQFEKEQTTRIETQKKYLIALGIAVVFLIIIIILAIVDMRFKSNSRKKLYLSSITDGLTQLSNRSHIIEVFESKLNKQIFVAMLDVDYFKMVNDTYGHIIGDEVLIGVANEIKKSIREQDFVGRYGGEEFLIIFDSVSYDVAKVIVERLRENISSIQWKYEGLQTTVSLGLLGCSGKILDGDAILKHVDALMYEAKRTGRNKVVSGMCTETEGALFSE